jgi:hypothetical protein
MLPNIRFRVNDTQIGLISTTVYQYAIIHLQKGVSCVVLCILEISFGKPERLTHRRMLASCRALRKGYDK